MIYLAKTVLALLLLGACALAQNQGQSRTVASVPETAADNASSTTSPRLGVEFGDSSPVAINQSSPYFWKTTPVGNSAQLLTLFCRACNILEGADQDVPLVSVLRDTLGDETEENDRITYVWLLTYARPRVKERLLSAVPFFYWRVSKGSGSVSERDMAPLMDMTVPENPMMSRIERNLIQWTAFDPLSTRARAVTREYGSNRLDEERLHLEEAISYFRQAPVSNDNTALAQSQLDTVIARLELRKTLLGGLTGVNRAKTVGMQSGLEHERIRLRNLELLRQWAEKTGLIFEPLRLNGNQEHYVILWFPQNKSADPVDTSQLAIWKLLGIPSAWNDERLKNWTGPVYERAFNQNSSARVVPLAIYSLDYPKRPLMLIDFRHRLSGRHREVAQRSITELISGVAGISHFADWYFYVALDFHRFVMTRHGTASDEGARLDSYSDFRMDLELDQSLDPTLKKETQRRVRWLAVNPLDAAPQREIQDAVTRYKLLAHDAEDGRLMRRVELERRFELSSFGESKKTKLARSMLHTATLGLYTPRAKRANTGMLDRERRVAYQLSFLDSLVQAGTPPEIAYDSRNIKSSVRELGGLMSNISSPSVRSHAEVTLERLRSLTKHVGLQADCTAVLTAMKHTDSPTENEAWGGASSSPSSAEAFSYLHNERKK